MYKVNNRLLGTATLTEIKMAQKAFQGASQYVTCIWQCYLWTDRLIQNIWNHQPITRSFHSQRRAAVHIWHLTEGLQVLTISLAAVNRAW